MGQLAMTIAGGAIGFMIGGPFGAQIGMMIGGMIGATLFGPTIKGPRLNDLKVTASTYGIAIPEIYGTVRLGGNLIWTSGIAESKKTSRAGKGGPKQTTYSYDATFAMGICKGTVDDILRVWADSKLIYDASASGSRTPGAAGSSFTIVAALASAVSGKKKKKNNLRMRVYRGDETQLPDSLIEAVEGTGNVSGHRGMCYVVFEKLQLEDFGNRIPQMTFEVTKSKTDAVTTVVTKNEDTSTTNTLDRQWLADFDTGRLLSFDDNSAGAWVYDLDTMAEITTDAALDLDFNDRGYSSIAGTNMLLVGNPPVSDVPHPGFAYYNTATLSLVSTHALRGGINNSYDEPDDEVSVSPAGRLGHGRFLSGSGMSWHVVHTDWMGVTFLMTSTGELIAEIDAPFSPHLFLEGKRSGSSSQIIGWRPANDRLELFVITTPAAAAHTVVEEGGDLVWVPYEDHTTEAINLQPYALETFVPAVLLYDQTDDHLFGLGTSAGVTTVFKYSLETETYKFIAKHPTLSVPGDAVQRMRSSRIAGGTFGWFGQSAGEHNSLIQIDLQTGVEVRKTQLDNSFGYTIQPTSQQMWDDESSSVLIARSNGAAVEFHRVFIRDGAAKINLPAIVEDICLRSGVLTVPDIDVTELNDEEVVGFAIDRECSARDALKLLATAYLFDGYESDYNLKFRSRGGESVVNIDESWVARNSDGVMMKETITQELEMPLRITVNYYDVSRDHQQGTQMAKRRANPFPTMWTRKEDIIDLPLAWEPDDAKQCADKLLKMAWANRVGYQFSLPWRFLKYDPTDVITVTMESSTVYALRLTNFNIGADFSIEAQAVSEEATAYVSTAVGNAGAAPQQNVSGASSAFPMIINTPLLRDADYDTSGSSLCYVSAGTNAISFGATVIYMDDGIEYRSVGAIDGETVSGYAIDALPTTLAYEATDETSVLKVRLSDSQMELESITQDDMLNTDANAALVGDEVIQFRDVDLQANGEWWLTGLRRARRGTNYAVISHAAGERFVLLDTSSLAMFFRPPETYVTTRSFKAAPTGTLVSDAEPVPADLIPRDLMPYTPEAVTITDDGTDVTITAQRRSRIMAPLTSGTATIHYKEGDKLSAKITYQVWPGLTVADYQTVVSPAFDGLVPLFDSSGDDIPVEITFPLADLDSEDTFLLCLIEVGEVDGIPKWVSFERLAEDVWNQTELY